MLQDNAILSMMLTAKHRSFWENATKESKTGNFSFWQGKTHIVGVTGPAVRKLLLEHPNLDFVAAQSLLAFGMHFWPPIHQIFHQTGARERNNTHFLRTLLALMKTPRLERVLPGLLKDARSDFKVLLPNNPSGVINSPDLWRTVFKQSTRLFFADDFAEDPKLFHKTADYLAVILHSYSPFYAFCHWILEPSMIRRRLARWGLRSTVQYLLKQRKKAGTIHKDDALQTMIDNGDPEEFITEFCASGTFITTTNAHIIFPQMIETMAVHPEWQEKVYKEIVAAADLYSKDKDAPLVDRLASLPLKAWETSFPTLELCLYEIIRVWTSFAVGRLNVSPDPIPIPGSDEVIPGHTFAVYNSTELNFDPKLFPNPRKFDPMRFTEGRREFEQEPHGCEYYQSDACDVG
jgi:cytochrome P450